MKRMWTLSLALMGLGCQEEPLGPSIEAERSGVGPPTLSVLTWNVYVGARLEELLLVGDPSQIPLEVARIVGAVQATDFPSRAAAIADQIARVRPDVISLQEVSLFRVQSPGDFLRGNPVPATTVFQDQMVLLDAALEERGLSYRAVSRSQNFDIELPMVNFSTGGLDDMRLTDFDVILVRQGVPYANPMNGNFAAVLPIALGGATLPKPSGWASVDVTVHGRDYRVVNTHLEAADIAPGVLDPGLAALQAAQARELSAVMSASPLPVLLTGDLNSAADGTSTTTYRDLLDEGFVDVWLAGPPRGPGYTSSQAPDLANPVSRLFHRIDFILFRNRVTPTSGRFTGSVKAEVVGDEPADRTPGGLWPSDHAGVFAKLTLAPGHGLRSDAESRAATLP